MKAAFCCLLLSAALIVACFVRNGLAVFDGLSLLGMLAAFASVVFALHADAVSRR